MAVAVEPKSLKSVLRLAIVDAAKNCAEKGAIATISLRSGLQFGGVLERPPSPGFDTIHMQVDQGWITIDVDEIVAVGAMPRSDY